jgi:hypothetical protein
MKNSSIILAIAIQAITAPLLLFAPFGFDHPSEWGLAFNHYVIFALACGTAFLYGTIVATQRRVWWAVAVQIIGLLVCFGIISIRSAQPKVHSSASEEVEYE